MWHRFQNHNFITYKEGRLTSNLGLQNVGSLTFFIIGGYSKKFSLTKKKLTVKFFFQKSLFHKKKLFTDHEFEKCCEAKKDAQGSYYWAQKKFQQEKIKIQGVAFISKKYLKSHFRDPKKRFFSISYFAKCFYMQSLPTANCSLIWPNFCTP